MNLDMKLQEALYMYLAKIYLALILFQALCEG